MAVVLPYTFTSLTKAKAAEVNANLQTLLDGVNLGLPSVPTGRVVSSLNEFLTNNATFNPLDYDAAGDGVANDTAKVQAAKDAAVLAAGASRAPEDVTLPPGKDFLVTGVTNTEGVRLVGRGRVLKAITGGYQQLNSYGDLHQYVFGREYMYAFWQRQLDGTGANIVLTGDSTTVGNSTSGDFIPDVILKKLARARGAYFQVFWNRGQSGEHSGNWEATRVAADITNGGNTPHLFIVRWGINDPYFGRTLAQFTTSMRNSLAAIRATYTVSQASIILMMPNSTADTPGARDERWYESISLAMRQMARDYKCVFYDTYARLRDSRSFPGTAWDDVGANQPVHPKNAMSAAIASDLADLMYPAGFAPVSTNRFENIGSADAVGLTTDTIASFNKGITINRANTADDALWPFNGAAMTVRHTDGTFALQWNWSFNNGATSLAMRVGQTATWYPWLKWFANKIVPGSNVSWSIRDSTDGNDNLLVTEAGRVTVREKVLIGSGAGSSGGLNIDASAYGNIGVQIVNSTAILGLRLASTIAQVGTYSDLKLDLLANSIAKVSILNQASGTATIKFNETVSRIIGGATSFAIRNNADSADNLIITDAGQATFRNPVILFAGTTSGASLRIPHGVAPTSPVDGDVWTTSTSFNIRINGATKSVNLT